MRCDICGDRSEVGRVEVRRSADKTDDGWVAMVQLRHGVEEMGDQPRAVADSRRRDVRSGNTDDAGFS